jgi:hydroxymethylglutaryl-CoA synthase
MCLDPDLYQREANTIVIDKISGYKSSLKAFIKAASRLMERLSLRATDINYFVAHQPNPQFPVKVAKELGFKDEQYAVSLQVNKFGNTYSGSSPVGLAAVLDVAKPEERILIASYGSGAGSDAYVFRTTDQLIEKRQRQKINVKQQAVNPFVEYVDYPTYRRLKAGM